MSALLAGPACGSSNEGAAAGAEGGACYPNETCNSGLTCASELCVALGGSAKPSGSTPDGDAGPAAAPPSTNTCKPQERATDFASCTSDDECFSGNCCLRGMAGCGHQGDYPGYCVHPNTTAYKAGHGYSCETDADCAAVAPDFIARGGSAHCYKDNVNDVPNGCGFDCSAPTNLPTTATGGAPNGGNAMRGAGGAPGTAGGTAAGGAEQSGGGAPAGAGGSTQGGGGAPAGAGGSTQGAAGAAQGGSTPGTAGAGQGTGGSSGGGLPKGAGGASSASQGAGS